METLDLNKKGFWAFWSRISLGKKADNLCLLGRTLIFSILTLPLWVFPGAIVNYFRSRNYNEGMQYWGWILVNFLLFLIGLVLQIEEGQTTITWLMVLYSYLAGIFIILLASAFFGSIAGLVYSVHLIWQRFRPKKVDVVKQYFHSMKEKHCKKINWVD